MKFIGMIVIAVGIVWAAFFGYLTFNTSPLWISSHSDFIMMCYAVPAVCIGSGLFLYGYDERKYPLKKEGQN